MPKQNECDHIVGEKQGHEQWLVTESSYIRDTMFYADWSFQKFNFCPLCGARIDWEKIKEGVDGKN